jgi:serine/threonine protein kinase
LDSLDDELHVFAELSEHESPREMRDLNEEEEQMQRVEKWRLEVSRTLLEEIEHETSCMRRLSTVNTSWSHMAESLNQPYKWETNLQSASDDNPHFTNYQNTPHAQPSKWVFENLKSVFNLLGQFRDQQGFEEPPDAFGWNSEHKIFSEFQPNILGVVSLLGHGSLGVVEQVRVSPNYSCFVRKRVQLPYHLRKKRLRIVKEEAEILRHLDHMHIVKIIGSYEESPRIGSQFYSLLMHPVGESDLKTYLDMLGDPETHLDLHRYHTGLDLLQEWFVCLVSALDYMHDRGVRHQDIKPSNIIFRGDRIYFTDFSSSARFDVGHTTSTENPGRTSEMYAAPEVIDSDDFTLKHGRGTDVFALGAVFCEMLAVIKGSSVQKFHEFLRERSGRGNRAGGIILYRRCISLAREYFREGPSITDSRIIYENWVHDMLAIDRDQRPNAEDLISHMTSSPKAIFRLISNPCLCFNRPITVQRHDTKNGGSTSTYRSRMAAQKLEWGAHTTTRSTR